MQLCPGGFGHRDAAAIAVPQRQGKADLPAYRAVVGGVGRARQSQVQIGELLDDRQPHVCLCRVIAFAQGHQVDPLRLREAGQNIRRWRIGAHFGCGQLQYGLRRQAEHAVQLQPGRCQIALHPAQRCRRVERRQPARIEVTSRKVAA